MTVKKLPELKPSEEDIESIKNALDALGKDIVDFWEVLNKEGLTYNDCGNLLYRIGTDESDDREEEDIQFTLKQDDKNITVIYFAHRGGLNPSEKRTVVNKDTGEYVGHIELDHDYSVKALYESYGHLLKVLQLLHAEHNKRIERYEEAQETLRRIILASKLIVSKTISDETLNKIEAVLNGEKEA